MLRHQPQEHLYVYYVFLAFVCQHLLIFLSFQHSRNQFCTHHCYYQKLYSQPNSFS